MSSDESIHALRQFPKSIGLCAYLQVHSEIIEEFNRRRGYLYSGIILIKQSQIPERTFVAQGSDKLAHKPSSPTVTARCLGLGLNTLKVDRQR